MAYKNIEDRINYDKEYYLKVRKAKYISHPRVKKTKEEKLATVRAYRQKNIERIRAAARRSWKNTKNREN